MKIKIEPAFVTMLNLDTATEGAIMKQHLPRARKIASASNLLALLGQRYGSAESGNTAGGQSMSTNRWFDCDPNRQTPQPHITDKNNTAGITSGLGLLTSELTINAEVAYPLSYQHMRVYIPLDPEKSVTIYPGSCGAFPARIDPCICYIVEID